MCGGVLLCLMRDPAATIVSVNFSVTEDVHL